MDLTTNAVQRWTHNEVFDGLGTWSPDGERFVFTRFYPGEAGKANGEGALIEIEWSTGQERELFRGPGFPGSPDYSPDGGQLAFHYGPAGPCGLWIMNADGSDAHPLFESSLDAYSPAWSPDGEWILYTAGRGSDSMGTFDLWIVRKDGSDARLVCNAPNTQMEPAWRPGEPLCF